MQRPSSALVVLALFWTVYGIVAAFAFYQELLPAKRELMMILGGTGVILVVLTLAVLRRSRAGASPDDRH